MAMARWDWSARGAREARRPKLGEHYHEVMSFYV